MRHQLTRELNRATRTTPRLREAPMAFLDFLESDLREVIDVTVGDGRWGRKLSGRVASRCTRLPRRAPSAQVRLNRTRAASCAGNEAALLEQRLDARIAPAERAIQRGRVLRAAAREDHVAEALAVRARQAAVLA